MSIPTKAIEAAIAALPFLAPQPSQTDEERARELIKGVECISAGDPNPWDVMKATKALAAVRAEERSAKVDAFEAEQDIRLNELAAKDAQIAALRAEFNEVNSQLTEAAGMAFRYKALLNDALWWLRKHNRHADLRARIEKEFAPRAALEMSGGVK